MGENRFPSSRKRAYALGLPKFVSVEVTNDAILTLPTTPVELVAAPGPGLLLWPEFMVAKLNRQGGGYTNSGATEDCYIRATTPGAGRWLEGPYFMAFLSSVYEGGENTYDYLADYLAGDGDDRIVVTGFGFNPSVLATANLPINQPLQLEAANGGDVGAGPNYTGGHVRNSLRLDIWLRTLDLT